jgi:hypothetical protein
MKASRLSTALLVAAALACSACSRLDVEWTAGEDEISLVAHGLPHATLVVLAGRPSVPHTMPGDPSIWTTVGSANSWEAGGLEVARTRFDASGVARASIKVGALPAEVVLVQALALLQENPVKAVGVSDCMAVARRSGKLRIRRHIIEVLDSSVWLRFGAVALVVALAILLKKARVPFFRAAGLGLAFLAAAALLADRWRAPRNQALPYSSPMPFLPNRIDEPRRTMDPLDRVTRPGFRELVNGARGMTADGDSIVIVPTGVEWEPMRDAWQAQWLLWPRHVEIVPPATDPHAERGLYLTFDGGPRKAGARILFKNRIGCLWAVDAGEPR